MIYENSYPIIWIVRENKLPLHCEPLLTSQTIFRCPLECVVASLGHSFLMTDIQIFNNPQFGEVRVVTTENGEPMFCLADVCKALELTNPTTVKNRLDNEDVQLVDLHALNPTEGVRNMDTLAV